MEYTKREADILKGIIPVDSIVRLETLQKIYDKALKADDIDSIQKVLPRLDYLKKVNESGYTEKQYKVITGETKDVTGQLASALLCSAQEKDDTDVIKLARSLVALSKKQSADKNRERAKNRMRKLFRNEKIEWKVPKSNEYTENQKKIIRGEIPVEKVRTNQLVIIHQKAKNTGDIELSERILSLIIDRRAKNRQRIIGWLNRPNKHNNSSATSINGLTSWERMVLDGDTEYSSIEDLEHILTVCEHKGLKDESVFISTVLWYRNHPEDLYVAKDRNAAISVLEQVLRKPIKRPESWFRK